MATLATLALIELNDLKLYLGFPTTTSSNDDFLIEFINAASERIEKYTNRYWQIREVISLYSGAGIDTMYVKEFPINAVSAVEYLDDDGVTWSELATSTEIEFENNKIILRGTTYPLGHKNIRLTMDVGVDDIPYDVQQVCKEVAAMYYYKSKVGERRLGVASESISSAGAMGRTFNSEDPLEQLLPYRRIPM